MKTKIQGMETWGTIEPKQDGLGMIKLIRDVTYRCDKMSQEMIGIVRVDKDLMLFHQKQHI